LEQDIHDTTVKKVKWQEAIDYRFSNIEHVLHKLKHDCTTDNIHEIRVQIKKLKALIRLFSFSTTVTSNSKFPKPLNKLYNSLGHLREWQIQKQHITKAADDLHYADSLAYMHKINRKADTCKRRVMKKISRLPDLKRTRDDIKNNSPLDPASRSVLGFVQSKMHTVQLVLQSGKADDESMHDMRKKIKDVQYVISGSGKTSETKKESSRLQSVQKVSGQLGDFHDMSVSLLLLKKELKTVHKDPAEKKLLRKIKGNWQTAKLEQRQQTILLTKSLIQQYFPEFG